MTASAPTMQPLTLTDPGTVVWLGANHALHFIGWTPNRMAQFRMELPTGAEIVEVAGELLTEHSLVAEDLR